MKSKSDNKIFNNWSIPVIEAIKMKCAINCVFIRIGQLINPFIYENNAFSSFIEVMDDNYEKFIKILEGVFLQFYELDKSAYNNAGEFSTFVEIGQNDRDVVLSFVDTYFGLFTYPIDEDALATPVDYTEG